MNAQTLLFGGAGQVCPPHELKTAHLPLRARLAIRLLAQLKWGALHLVLPDGQTAHFGDDSYPITLQVHDWSVFEAVSASGDIGLAEGYLAQEWTTDNLVGLIELFIRNRGAIEQLVYGHWWGRLGHRLQHWLNRNTRQGSRKNIHAHYDLGNAFYRLWLDQSMTYSSALFSSDSETLYEAQQAKYRRILQQLQLKPGAHVLEIGCGWGGFAELALRNSDVHLTGLTLSTEQLAYARQRLSDAGLAHRADLQLRDYRDQHEQFDAIASIEMFEAVGEQYWADYFACLLRNLKPGGRACIQTIVIADELFERYRRSTDFIQQYIFPGGMLPSAAVFRQRAQRAGLRVVESFAFGQDYARTLHRWREDFLSHLGEVMRQGFDRRFTLTWEFYLAYCEAAFRAGSTNVMQFTLERP